MRLEVTASEPDVAVAKVCIAARKQVGMLTEQDGPVLFRSIALRSSFITLSNCQYAEEGYRR
jgi:hypothetical protein